MAARDIMFETSLTDKRIEYAYGLASRAQQANKQNWADIGMRAAKARDPKLLLALEKMAEVTGRMQEQQIGRMMRDPGSTFSESRGTTEHQLCREAYKMVDEGTPVAQLQWYYVSAAWLCGYIV